MDPEIKHVYWQVKIKLDLLFQKIRNDFPIHDLFFENDILYTVLILFLPK